MLRCVVWLKFTDVSEVLTASVITVQHPRRQSSSYSLPCEPEISQRFSITKISLLVLFKKIMAVSLRPLAKPRRRWEDNIKIVLMQIVFGVWIGLIWLRIGSGGGIL
jgi:hypothetical protein